jgi:hypothetical protein
MRHTVRDPDARPCRSTTKVAARVRLCAAARHADPVAIDAERSAHAAAVNRALHLRFAHIVRDLLRADRRWMSRRYAAHGR